MNYPQKAKYSAHVMHKKFVKNPKYLKQWKKVDHPQNAEFSELDEVLAILADLQKLRLEEAALIGVKQHLTEAQQEFQNRVKEEIERTKIEINNLWSEIGVLEDRCKELSELVPAPFSARALTAHSMAWYRSSPTRNRP